MMRKVIYCILFAMIVAIPNTYAAEVPKEAIPAYAAGDGVIVAERLISDILDEVRGGLGYADAVNRANNRIWKAATGKETNGHGYAELAAIARNAIFQYRDMYLRPEYYQAAEEWLTPMIADLVAAVADGTMEYPAAVKEAYERIYQSEDAGFQLEQQFALDTCYRDIPAVDSAYFTIARKLLLEAEK